MMYLSRRPEVMSNMVWQTTNYSVVFGIKRVWGGTVPSKADNIKVLSKGLLEGQGAAHCQAIPTRSPTC
jgi:hypothetical protein